jgi:succinyl-diaminopimelate desuccinylase
MPLADPATGPERDAAFCLLRDLVRADSINPPGNTTGPAGIARTALDGLPIEFITADPAKPNLVVTLDNGPGPSIHLNAHLDTVPPGDISAWTVPIHELTARDGALYGLGTGNMKAAAAAMILAVRRLDQTRGAWRGRVILSLVADECVFGPDGAHHLLAERPELAGDHLICGEGAGAMHLAIAEKGLMWVRITATGRVGQGMLTKSGTSAPARLAAALAVVDGWNQLTCRPPLPSLDHPANAEGMRLSANIGRIAGGSGFSPAVSEATADLDLRLPPGLTMAEVSARLDGLCADGHLSWSLVKGWEANWSPPDCAPACSVRAMATAVLGAAPRDVTRLPAADASRWRALGIPAVCYGPQPDLASGVDDHVNEADFLACLSVYAGAVAHLSQTAE